MGLVNYVRQSNKNEIRWLLVDLLTWLCLVDMIHMMKRWKLIMSLQKQLHVQQMPRAQAIAASVTFIC